MNGKVSGQGMEIPIEILQLKNGKQYVKITFQGKEIMQGVYDGEVLWNTNFMTQKPEAMTSEQIENFKKNSLHDFPSAFLNYKEKGYAVELLGEENVEGTDCYKLKLIQNKILIDGKEEDAISFYYFDKENFVPIVMESEIKSGPMKGKMMKSTMSDYEEVDGLYFPMALSQMGGPFNIDKIELNPKVDDAIFIMPKVEENKEEVKEEVKEKVKEELKDKK
jgi:outer membrane lipoprotein-sorting protein